MTTLLGAVKGNERSGRYISDYIKNFIDSLNEKQLRNMKRNLGAEMRLTITKKDKSRLESLKREMEYINYRLGK
jgi:hypothetical protein